MEELLHLFEQWRGRPAANVTQLPLQGSNRRYYRMTDEDGKSVIGVIGTAIEENHAFIYLSSHFRMRRLPVPEVLAATGDERCYLQTDLGSLSLFDALKSGRDAGGRYTDSEKELLVKTIRALPDMQIRGARGLQWENCYPQPGFDIDGVLFDLNYFKYCFLKATGTDFHELKLEADFRLLAKDLTAETGESFLYRDFQARNVMLDAEGNPHFIDYQGGRKGPYYYDVASFLWQASANYPHKLRRELVYEYYHALKHYTEVPSKRHFVDRLALFVLFRTLQVLGAYGFRGYFERKKHFLDSIPFAVRNLRELLDEGNFSYPYLEVLLRQITELPQFQSATTSPGDGKGTLPVAHPMDGSATVSKYDNRGNLVVRIFSFSFHRGIPEDESGNGGGYVFDCRSTHNPGRYKPYQKLTGLDEPVIRFLEDDGEITAFLRHVYAIADTHVERYMERGFTDLMFSFGCTGGQHRSVYSAQHLALHLHERYGIEVRVVHREQGKSFTFAAKP